MHNAETRVPWGDFPPVFIFCPLGAAKQHDSYEKAKKRSDNAAALKLVKELICQEKMQEFFEAIKGQQVSLVPVHAIEEFGTNKIPAALAYHLSHSLGLGLYNEIVQANKPQRTHKGAFYRLSQYPFFDGAVQKDTNYVILDDTLSMGGTVASLRGYIENKGGKVLFAATLTGHEAAASINIKEAMLSGIKEKHGEKLDEWWKSEVGFGVDKLTQGEAGHIKKAPTFEEVRSRIIEARSEK